MNESLFPNPERYTRMSVPHSCMEDLDKDIQAFRQGVSELREKHGLADVLVIIETPVVIDEEARMVSTHAHYGDQTRTMFMAARVYGIHRAELDEQLKMLDAIAKGEK